MMQSSHDSKHVNYSATNTIVHILYVVLFLCCHVIINASSANLGNRQCLVSMVLV